ncbi:hypothetical protein BDZ45DRAFT_752230 [Acephala macrosclerotiorum]|nr:hypothetical protein BDZ45DRAFT_752230 [Acephala macrosclerotiorum]
MKLVISGATGFVGREVLRQALKCPDITSVVTIGRRPVTVKDSTNISKLTDIVMEDGEHYSDSDIEKISDAEACIWYQPNNLTLFIPSYPLRFIYISGSAISRDMNQDFNKWSKFTNPKAMKLRCMLEIELINYASNSSGRVGVCCVRPGYILGDREILGWPLPIFRKEFRKLRGRLWRLLV